MSAKSVVLRGPGPANTYSMSINWGTRPESPEQLAERLARGVKAVQPIHPLLRSWWFTDLVEFEHVPMDEVGARLVDLVRQGVVMDDDDEPDPDSGYSFAVVSQKESTPQTMELRGHVGARGVKQFFGNGCVVSTAHKQAPDPAIIAYPIFKAVMMAMVDAWSATSASAICSELWDVRQDSGRFFAPAWMTYLAGPLASRITPPAAVPCEIMPDGGVLMIAAEETFDMSNPAHYDNAWAISDALASLTEKELWY